MNRQNIFSDPPFQRYECFNCWPSDVKTYTCNPGSKINSSPVRDNFKCYGKFLDSKLFKLHRILTNSTQKDTNCKFLWRRRINITVNHIEFYSKHKAVLECMSRTGGIGFIRVCQTAAWSVVPVPETNFLFHVGGFRWSNCSLAREQTAYN
jgi:hypothetical protein